MSSIEQTSLSPPLIESTFLEYRPGVFSQQTGPLTDEELKAMITVFKILSTYSLPTIIWL